MQQFSDLNLTQSNLEELMVLVESEEDVKNFRDNYWRGIEKQFFAIQDFREHKLNVSPLTYEEFESLYKQDKKEALEKLFKHAMLDLYIETLEEKLNSGTITLKRLYDMHDENPLRNMMRFLL